MSDGESYSSQPPALEDADLDDVSSNASFVSDDSDSVSIDTDASDDSEYSSEHSGNNNNNNGALGTPFVVPLKDDSDSEESDSAPPTAQNGQRVRRQSSSAGRLSTMRNAAAATGEVSDGPRRRAPPRTKSGDGFAGGAPPPRRRAPARTKSSELNAAMVEPKVEEEVHPDGDRKEGVLKRNVARRQKSSEMLLAMQESARKAPNRSKSSGAALQRQPPPRTKSGDMGSAVAGGEENRPRRRAAKSEKSEQAKQAAMTLLMMVEEEEREETMQRKRERNTEEEVKLEEGNSLGVKMEIELSGDRPDADGRATDQAETTGETSANDTWQTKPASVSSDSFRSMEEELMSDDGEISEDSGNSEENGSQIDSYDEIVGTAILQIQCLFRTAMAKKRTATQKKDKKRLKRLGKKSKKAAIRIQALVRGVIQRQRYRQPLLKKKEDDPAKSPREISVRSDGTKDRTIETVVPAGIEKTKDGDKTEEMETENTNIPEEIAVILEASTREAANKSKLRAETLQFLDTLHGYLVCRGKMDLKYKDIDEFEIIAGHEIRANISDMRVSADDPRLYNSLYQQQSIHGQPVKTLSELYEAAEQSKPVYEEVVKSVIRKLLAKYAEPAVDIVVNLSELKGKQRAQEKAEDDYAKRRPKPGLSWLYDVVRGSVEFSSAKHVIEFLELIQEEPSITIVKAKNRFREPSLTGYRDLNIQFQVDTGKGFHHTCELQIHHKAIKELDEELQTHKFYEYFRSYFAGATSSLKARLAVLKLISDRGVIDSSFLTELLQSSEDIERLERLGILFRDQLSEYHWAYRVFVRLFEILKDRYGTRDPSIAQAYNDIALVLKEQGKLEEAMVLYKESLDIGKAAYGNQHSTVAKAYFNMALVLKEQDKLSDSMDLFQQSLSIMKRDLGDESLPVANVYNCMATVLRKQGKYDSAMKLFEKSLGIKRVELGDVDSSIADTMQNIAILLKLNGKLKESADLFQESIDIATKSMGENHPSVAAGCRNMALVLEKQRKLDAALKLYGRSLDIYKANLGEKHILVADIYDDMAYSYKLQGNRGRAKGLLLKSLSIKKKLFAGRVIEAGLRKKIVNQRRRSQNIGPISRRAETV